MSNGNGALRLAETCKQLIEEQAKRSRATSAVTWEDLARRIVTGLRIPLRGTMRDIKACFPKIARLLRSDTRTGPYIVHQVTAAYFGMDEAEERLRAAALTVLQSEGTEEAHAARAFVRSILPVGKGNRGVGVRIVKDSDARIDLPWYEWLVIQKQQTLGKRDAVKDRIVTSAKAGILTGRAAKQLKEGLG